MFTHGNDWKQFVYQTDLNTLFNCFAFWALFYVCSIVCVRSNAGWEVMWNDLRCDSRNFICSVVWHDLSDLFPKKIVTYSDIQKLTWWWWHAHFIILFKELIDCGLVFITCHFVFNLKSNNITIRSWNLI